MAMIRGNFTPKKTDTVKKYRLTSEKSEFEERIIYRIQATKNFSDVKAGDLGGWVESESNLSQEGDCWVYDDAMVLMNAFVSDNAKMKDKSVAMDNAILSENALMKNESMLLGNARLSANAKMFDKGFADKNALITDNAVIKDNAIITRNAEIRANQVVDGVDIIPESGISNNCKKLEV